MARRSASAPCSAVVTWLTRAVARRRARGFRRGRDAGRDLPALVRARPARDAARPRRRRARCADCSTPAPRSSSRACGALGNAILNVVLVYGVGMGIAGSGLGTATTQVAMGIALSAVVVRGARRTGAALRPAARGILANARAGGPLFVRTLSLRLALLLTVVVATSLGPVPLAAHQVVSAVWGLAAFALDALAIAAQALVGHALGASDVRLVRALLRRTLQWGVGAGAALGLVARRPELAVRAAVHLVRRPSGRPPRRPSSSPA